MADGHHKRWQLKDAMNNLSLVVDQACRQGPQVITRQGKDTAIVLSWDDYQALLLPRDSLAAFFQRSPLAGFELDVVRSEDIGRGADF